jgi:hypothetical protein
MDVQGVFVCRLKLAIKLVKDMSGEKFEMHTWSGQIASETGRP